MKYNIWKWTCCITMLILTLALGFGLALGYTKTKHIKEMDANELHYDADSWFIMVDKEHNLIGVYYATDPIFHEYCDTDRFENGVIDIPTLVYGGTEDKSTWWYEGHTKKGE